MADRTLLDYTQDILNETSGDEINSIADTIEATSIARMVRQVYFELIDEQGLPYTKKLTALTGLGDLGKPTHMGIPQDVSLIEWIEYDCRTHPDKAKAYHTIQFLDPHDFVRICNMRNSEDTDNYQVVMTDANVALIIGRTHYPQHWTSFDDKYIVFDSYDILVESTLQSSKSICHVDSRPGFLLTDDFVPVLPDNLTNVLYIQALNRCIVAYKESVNPITTRQESRQRVRAQRNKWRQQRQVLEGPDYGR